jgi:hypothetical protein
MIFVLLLYTVFGYYTDGYLYRRRQRGKAAAAAKERRR